MTVVVRLAEPGELELVGRLTVDAYVADGLLDPEHDYVHELKDAVRRAEQATLLVAAEGDEVLGTITLAALGSPYAEIAEPGEIELRMLAVDPGAWGRGIGETLMRAAIDRGIAEGASRVVLSTLLEMTTAQRIYDRLGLRRAPERDWAGTGHTMLVYVADTTRADLG